MSENPKQIPEDAGKPGRTAGTDASREGGGIR